MFYWDPNPEVWTIPYFHIPILWYGVLFALGFIVGAPLFRHLYVRRGTLLGGSPREKLQKEGKTIVDALVLYMVLGTLIGARLGHFLFYERPSHYLSHLGELFGTQGLSSHGAIVGILIAVAIFAKRHPSLSFFSLLDLISVPAAFASGMIRIGNFINQEILGTLTTLPWGVVFGHPADHSIPAPRHPVQLYEAIFYFFLCALFARIALRTSLLSSPGKIGGLFLLVTFAFRFFIEFWKEEQSLLLHSEFSLTMGQLLSVPIMVFGGWLYFRKSTS